MPQVDLETLVCGADGRVACETVVAAEPPDPVPDDPDLPVESFEVRIGDEIDWVDLNAVYDRDDSTKGNTNPKSQHSSSAPPTCDRRRSNSQRFSGNLKPKAPIIGLPNKLQYSGYLGRSTRRAPNSRIFPKKGGKGSMPEHEPGSPKVSCIGKVLSEREKERRRIRRRESREERRGGGKGFWASLLCCFSADRGTAVECIEEESPVPSGNIPEPARRSSAANAADAPSLGAMKRFSSGRRAASWGGDEEEHVVLSGPFSGRRSVGSLEDAGA
ncbi:Calcium/calmodulin-dependent protein kinase protein [Dioscorea alata]|uniref:Calcium/calmodulin-dependent protein kinase protein n=1 Tax=Dioscorea alata TaxID=55571 RepID=A0ACB7VCM7_DIOAL|nr:Calcium/calmodulin-dependent protein kinase protein [Dioscorea alata]